MGKKILIVVVVVIVLVLAGAVYFILTSGSSRGVQGTVGALPPIATGTTNLISTSSFPSGDTFQIGTSQGVVTVKNIYKSNDYITQDQQTVVLVENDTYTTVYNRDDSGFIIALLSVPGSLQTARDAAEANFLSQLGISESDACKLAVDERVLDKSSPYDGELMGLSFCGSSTTP
jgi:hypothetical protein